MSKEKTFNGLKIFELILSVLFMIGAFAISVIFFWAAFSSFNASNNLINSNNGFAVFTGVFTSFSGFLLLGFASFLFFLTIGFSVMLIMSYMNREKEGRSYTITSIIFLVISAIYMGVISSFFFSSLKNPIDITMIIMLVLMITYIPLFIEKIVSIALKKKAIEKEFSSN